MTEPRHVWVAHLRSPIGLGDGRHAFYYIMLEGGDDFVNHEPPAIYDAKAQPLSLAAELAPGSVVRLDVEGATVKSVMVLHHVTANPFAEFVAA